MESVDCRRFARYIREIHEVRMHGKQGFVACYHEVLYKAIEDYLVLVFRGIVVDGKIAPAFTPWPKGKYASDSLKPIKYSGYDSAADVTELLEFLFGSDLELYMDFAGITFIEPYTLQRALKTMTRDKILINMYRNGYRKHGDGTYRKDVTFGNSPNPQVKEIVRNIDGDILRCSDKAESHQEALA